MFGQNNDTTSLRGCADSLVVVDMATIKEANIKLVERKVLKVIVDQQDSIIASNNKIIDEYKAYNIYLTDENIKLNDSYYQAVELNEKLEKSIKRKNVGLYTLGSISLTAITFIIIKCIVGNGK